MAVYDISIDGRTRTFNDRQTRTMTLSGNPGSKGPLNLIQASILKTTFGLVTAFRNKKIL